METTPVEELDFDQLASNCPVHADPGLINQEQEHKLRQTVADFWRWSSQTNFEVYRDLRLKTPYVLNQRAVDGQHELMVRRHKAANWPTDAEEILRCNERPTIINTPLFEVHMDQAKGANALIREHPSNEHPGAGIGFADGHVELKQWRTSQMQSGFPYIHTRSL